MAPSTPPRKPSKQHVEDILLKATLDFLQVLSLPESFTTLRRFLDRRSPQDSGQHLGNQARLAGRNLEEIRFHELTWQGWSNHNLRALTQDRYVSVNFARSIKEATFISFLLQHVAENAKKVFRMKELAQWVRKQLQP